MEPRGPQTNILSSAHAGPMSYQHHTVSQIHHTSYVPDRLELWDESGPIQWAHVSGSCELRVRGCIMVIMRKDGVQNHRFVWSGDGEL